MAVSPSCAPIGAAATTTGESSPEAEEHCLLLCYLILSLCKPDSAYDDPYRAKQHTLRHHFAAFWYSALRAMTRSVVLDRHQGSQHQVALACLTLLDKWESERQQTATGLQFAEPRAGLDSIEQFPDALAGALLLHHAAQDEPLLFEHVQARLRRAGRASRDGCVVVDARRERAPGFLHRVHRSARVYG